MKNDNFENDFATEFDLRGKIGLQYSSFVNVICLLPKIFNFLYVLFWLFLKTLYQNFFSSILGLMLHLWLQLCFC